MADQPVAAPTVLEGSLIEGIAASSHTKLNASTQVQTQELKPVDGGGVAYNTITTEMPQPAPPIGLNGPDPAAVGPSPLPPLTPPDASAAAIDADKPVEAKAIAAAERPTLGPSGNSVAQSNATEQTLGTSAPAIAAAASATSEAPAINVSTARAAIMEEEAKREAALQASGGAGASTTTRAATPAQITQEATATIDVSATAPAATMEPAANVRAAPSPAATAKPEPAVAAQAASVKAALKEENRKAEVAAALAPAAKAPAPEATASPLALGYAPGMTVDLKAQAAAEKAPAAEQRASVKMSPTAPRRQQTQRLDRDDPKPRPTAKSKRELTVTPRAPSPTIMPGFDLTAAPDLRNTPRPNNIAVIPSAPMPAAAASAGLFNLNAVKPNSPAARNDAALRNGLVPALSTTMQPTARPPSGLTLAASPSKTVTSGIKLNGLAPLSAPPSPSLKRRTGPTAPRSKPTLNLAQRLKIDAAQKPAPLVPAASAGQLFNVNSLHNTGPTQRRNRQPLAKVMSATAVPANMPRRTVGVAPTLNPAATPTPRRNSFNAAALRSPMPAPQPVTTIKREVIFGQGGARADMNTQVRPVAQPSLPYQSPRTSTAAPGAAKQARKNRLGMAPLAPTNG